MLNKSGRQELALFPNVWMPVERGISQQLKLFLRTLNRES